MTRVLVVTDAEILLLPAELPVGSQHAALVLVALLVEDRALYLVVMFAKSFIIVNEALHAVNHILSVHFEEPVHRQELFQGVLDRIVDKAIVHSCAKLLALLVTVLLDSLPNDLE